MSCASATRKLPLTENQSPVLSIGLVRRQTPPSSLSMMSPLASKAIDRESACGELLLAVPPPLGPMLSE